MLRQTLVAVIVLASVGPAAAQADRHPTMVVGTASAARGTTAYGTIDVPAGTDAGVSIPVAVVHGAKPGPVLALVAGAHGTEYASVVALAKLISRLDPQAVSGTVIVVPLLNLASFERKVVHVNPTDGKNLNRLYPGRRDGTQTERISYAVTTQVVEQCDHLIDYHGGDLDESLRPFVYWNKTDNAALADASKALALAFGLDYIVVSADRPRDPRASMYLENTATTRGKPSLTVEAGHAGTVDPEDVDVLIDGTLSVMRHLRMLAGTPLHVDHPQWIVRLDGVTSPVAGLFTPTVRRGMYVGAGTRLGSLTDYLGRPLGDVRAPAAGVVLYVAALPSMTQGDTVATIGILGATP